MPTRTINLKLITGRKGDTAELRRALWLTHREINRAVGQIERVLLLCRGASYWTLDEKGNEVKIPESQVAAEALNLARVAQRKNIGHDRGTDAEVLALLRKFHELIIPSCVLDDKGNPQKGDAQAANAWVSPLMDPESEGGLSVFDKVLDPVPIWIEKKNLGQPGWENDSITWLESEDGKRLQTAPGSPPGWVRKLRNNQPWQDDFIKDQEKKRKEVVSGNAPVVRNMKNLGLLPLLQPSLKKMLDPHGKGVTVWDRLAIRLAAAHLLSWESWNHTTKKAHEKAKMVCDALRGEYQGLATSFDTLRQYEKARHQELKRVAFADDDRPFKTGGRAIRAWDRVREAWLTNGNTAEDRKTILADLQTKLRGQFGDPDLFLWLAEGGREHLWRDADGLTPLVKLNIAERLLEKRKEYSLMTFADACRHPRWTMYEAPGGTNLRNYRITKTPKGLNVTLPLLVQDAEGKWTENEFTISLAPSGQLSSLDITKDGKKERFAYRSAHQDFEGVPGGAELLFDRPYLENCGGTEEILCQKPGPVWFKLTLDVQSQAPANWLDGKGRAATPPEIHHFKTALSNKSKHTDKLKPGLRVLSVDLGLRTFASCSVFELVQGKPENGLCFPAADGREESDPQKLWAKHERSFKLALPGETPTKKEEEARKTVLAEIRSLRRDLGRLKDLLRLSAAEDEPKRAERIKVLMESLEETTPDSALKLELFEGLGDSQIQSTPDLWKQHCLTYYAKAEKIVAKRLGDWRKRTRPKSDSWADWRERRGYHGGKSVWMLEYLEAVRKMILSWNLRGRSYGAVNRQDKKKFGTVASSLLDHINKLKDDRVKSGADLIVQAARGFVPNKEGNGWKKKHQPCRLILFEDLARYRFRVDRPRRENSQLMRWNHREIIGETTMQAELYGMKIETTAAGFTSRYLASSGAPGVRCRNLRADDFENGLPKTYAVFELEWMLGNLKGKNFEQKQNELKNLIKPGMLVPWGGGELFASIGDGNRFVHVIHADINAAQNLQRRFWSRCGDAFRIACRRAAKDGTEGYELDKAPGARLLGALQQLEHGAVAFHLVPDPNGQPKGERYVLKPTGGKRIKSKADGEDTTSDDADLEEAFDDLGEESDGGRETFFRDPSGIVFKSHFWIPSKQYWSIVKWQAWRAMPVTGGPDQEEVFNADDVF